MDKGNVVTETLRRLGQEAATPAATTPRIPAASAPTAGRGDPVDFVLCVGDDTTDEDMFAAVSGWAAAAGGRGGGAVPAVYTVTVGKKVATAAGSWLLDVAGVQQLIMALAGAGQQ